MRLKVALKVSQVEHALDQHSEEPPRAKRKQSNGIEWQVHKCIIFVEDAKARIFAPGDIIVKRIDIEGVGWNADEQFNCKSSLFWMFWHLPIVYLRYVIGKNDWEPE